MGQQQLHLLICAKADHQDQNLLETHAAAIARRQSSLHIFFIGMQAGHTVAEKEAGMAKEGSLLDTAIRAHS